MPGFARLLCSLTAVAFLAACGADNHPDDAPQAVAAAAYRSSEPPSLTIFTMVNNRTGSGGHTSLLVNGSQQVLFDPAGSFRDDRLAERGDVLYGVSPAWVKAYKSAHARETFHVVEQKIPVTAEQAEQALRMVQANGSVGGGFCTNSTSSILARINGFLPVQTTFYPVKLMEQLNRFPNVTTTKLYENDAGEVVDALRVVALPQ